MKQSPSLHQYYMELCKEFHRLFIEVLEAYQRDTVHDLRVHMKRMHAFFRFVQVVDPAFVAKDARKAFGDLYDIAGQVRDIQVERLLLRQRTHLEPFLAAWMHREEETFRARLQTFLLEHTLVPIRTLEHQTQTTLSSIPPTAAIKGFEGYLKQLFKKINRVLLDESLIHQLHYLRKRLKQLLFTIQLLQWLYPEQPSAKKSIKALDTLQKRLGDWHDLDFIRSILTQEPSVCPAKIRHKIDRDFLKTTSKILEILQPVPETLHILEIQILDLLHAIPLETAKEMPSAPRIRKSLPPHNLEDRIK